jgi:hypothetical protein
MAGAIDHLKYGIRKFDGKDFILWKDRIENTLEASKCSDAIKEDFDLSVGEDNVIKNKKEQDTKAKLILMSSMQDSFLRKVPRTLAKEIWKALKSRYEEKNGANILVLKKNFLSSKQAANENVEKFIDRIKSATGGSKKTDTSMTILFGLLPLYENFFQFMTMMKKNIILDDVVSELLAEDKRRKKYNQINCCICFWFFLVFCH